MGGCGISLLCFSGVAGFFGGSAITILPVPADGEVGGVAGVLEGLIAGGDMLGREDAGGGASVDAVVSGLITDSVAFFDSPGGGVVVFGVRSRAIVGAPLPGGGGGVVSAGGSTGNEVRALLDVSGFFCSPSGVDEAFFLSSVFLSGIIDPRASAPAVPAAATGAISGFFSPLEPVVAWFVTGAVVMTGVVAGAAVCTTDAGLLGEGGGLKGELVSSAGALVTGAGGRWVFRATASLLAPVPGVVWLAVAGGESGFEVSGAPAGVFAAVCVSFPLRNCSNSSGCSIR